MHWLFIYCSLANSLVPICVQLNPNFNELFSPLHQLFKLILHCIQLSLKIIQKPSAFHSTFDTASASHKQPKVSNLLLTPPQHYKSRG